MNADDGISANDADDGDASVWVWAGLVFTATVSFWCQAVVTEERFVPALNMIANYFNIPDDVAGATLMAAGASSPELFSSLVSLFITHSALGLGTIVGSEIFNQLMICAGSIMAARSGQLELDKAVIIREVGFYGLSIVLLLTALSDRRPAPDDDEFGPDHIYINCFQSSLVFGGYVLYVIVCSNFDWICSLLSKKGSSRGEYQELSSGGSMSDSEAGSSRSRRTGIEIPEKMPFLRQLKREPKGNFHHPGSQKDLMAGAQESSVAGLYRTFDGNKREEPRTISEHLGRSDSQSSQKSAVADSLRLVLRRFSDGASMKLFSFMVDVEKPSDHHELYDMESNDFEERLSCFLWQQSIFYNKAKVALNGWHLRWFTFTHGGVVSVPDRVACEKHKLTYPRFSQIEVDVSRLVVKLISVNPNGRDYFLMAPSSRILSAVVAKLESVIKNWEEETQLDTTNGKTPIEMELSESEDANSEPPLIEFPHGESTMTVLIHLILFPLKLLMHITIPDVRLLSPKGDPKKSVSTSFISSFSCLAWLIVGSYAMVASLEALADLLDIPDAVVGVTVSAAGTSLPNYVASQVAAKQGMGNMAISNAFGSNTFNICVGLGLPWMLYTAFGTNGEPYHGLRDDGITMSVILLASVLLVFIVLILISNFVLYRWHAFFFLGLYVAYLAFAIGQVFISK